MALFEGQKKLTYSNVISLVSSRKLDTALRRSTAESFLTRRAQGSLTYDDKFFMKACEESGLITHWERVKLNQHVWCYLLFDLLSGKYNAQIDGRESRDILEICRLNLIAQSDYLVGCLEGNLKQRTMHAIFSWIKDKLTTLPLEILAVSNACLVLSKIIEEMASIVDVRITSSAERLDKLAPKAFIEKQQYNIKIAWSEALLAIQYKHQITIVPRAYALLLHNKCSDTLSVLLYAFFNTGASLESSCYNLTVTFLKSLALIHQRLQNKGMIVSKSLEALGIGLTLIECDGESNSAFLNEIQNNLQRDINDRLVSSEFYRILALASIPLRHELMCLSKILGHPFVDMEAGAAKLHHKTTMQLDVDQELLLNCVRYAKRSFIKNYILKHGKWPPIIFLRQSPVLPIACLRNRDPDSAVFSSAGLIVNIEDYDSIEIQPISTFNYLDNIIPYLKDKTISVLRSKVIQKYINNETLRLNWEDTRLLLLYLLHDIDSSVHQDYIKKWCEAEPMNFNLLQDYLVIRVVPKEKELKIEFRGFGCKTYEDRMRTICQELNVADYMDNYCNEQALTLSELDIMKRLCNFRRIAAAYKGYTPIFIVIDASAWNNKFRHETVFPVMDQTLDKIFGVKIFSRTMLAYENSLIYIPDSMETRWWDGQLGGIEGLNQYTWDCVYLPQIRACLHGTGYDPKLFAKGDDLRAVILVPPDLLEVRTIEEIRYDVVNTLTENMKKLGHDININESYGSLSYFAFSKIASVSTMELPEGMRKIQKAYGANNSFLPLLDDYIGSSFSVCHSACKTSSNPLSCYAIGLFWASWHLTNNSTYGKLSNVQIASLLNIPSLLGGFPIIYLHNIWIRAESDLLSPFLGLLKFVEEKYPNMFLVMRQFLKVRLIPPLEAFRGLLVDPYSLPISKPSNAITILRRLILPAIKSKIKNSFVKELISYGETAYVQQLVQWLASCNVYNAKLLSAIYAASPTGLLDEMTRKFESARSVNEVLILRWGRRGASRRLLRVLRAEERVHSYRINKVRSQDNCANTDLWLQVQHYLCPAEAAQVMRCMSWGKDVEGITMPPLQHQVKIIEFGTRPLNQWEQDNSFQIITHQPTYPRLHKANYALNELPIYRIGPRKPFRGFATRSGKTAPVLKIIESNEILDRVKTLIDLLDWVNIQDEQDGVLINSNLHLIIRKLISLYIPQGIEDLMPFQSGKKAGTIEHHIRCRQFRESIMPNMLGNIYTRVEGVTNCHLTLRHSNLHYHVNYLFILCFATSIIHVNEIMNNVPSEENKYYLNTINCEFCMRPIIEHPVRCNEAMAMQFNPPNLHQLSLSKDALAILRRSLEVRPARVQTEGTNISQVPRLCIEVCLLQHFITNINIGKKRIADFTYHHPCDEESYDLMSTVLGMKNVSDIGLSEFKRIRTEAYLNQITIIAIEYIYRTWPDNNTQNIASYLSAQPNETLPWYPLVCIIFEVGRLTDLIHMASSKSDLIPPACYESKSAATNYLGLTSYVIYHRSQAIRLICAYETILELDGLDNRTNTLLFIMKHRWAKAHLYPYISNLSYENLNVARNFYDVLLLFWACPIIMSQLQDVIETATLNSVFDVPLIDIDAFVADDLYDVINEQSLPRVTTTLWTIPIFNNFPEPYVRLSEIMDNIEEFERAKNLLIQYNLNLVIQVFYTTISDCINGIRRFNSIFPIQDDLAIFIGDLEARMRDINLIGTRSMSYAYPVIPYNGYDDTYIDIVDDINYEPLGEDIPYVKTWCLYRSQGFGTSAPSKLISVLKHCDLLPLPNCSVYWTLADGIGGSAATINELVHRSVIFFNTLIVDPHHEHYPSACTRNTNNNLLNYDAMTRNISDLTDINTILNIDTTLRASPVLITCDAQTQGLEEGKRFLLVRNVMYAFFSYCTLNGVLILKLYVNEPSINLRLIHWCIMTNCRIIIIKPEASGGNKELYIVIQKKRAIRNLLLESMDEVQYPPANVGIIIQKRLLGIIRKGIRDRITRSIKLRGYITEQPRIPKFSHPEALILLPSYCGISMTVEEWTFLAVNPVHEIYRRLLTLGIESTSAIWHEIERSRNPNFRTAAEWDVTTVAHKKVLINRLMCIKGFTLILGYALSDSDFTNENVVTAYFNVIRELPEDYILPRLEYEETLRKTFVFKNESWQPYRYMLKGVEIGLMLIGYFLPHIQQ